MANEPPNIFGSNRDNENNDTTQGKSKVARAGFLKSLGALIGGWVTNNDKKDTFSRNKLDLDFVKIKQPDSIRDLLNHSNILRGNGSEKLEKLFDSYLQDVTDISYQDRMKLVSEIDFMAQTDPFISRYLALEADEATQLDVQDNIISVESSDTRLTNRIYSLMRQWGITQNRIRSTIYSIAKYGDAFWGQKISDKGVEKIFPLSVKQILTRLEFNPINVISELNQIKGFSNLMNKDSQIQTMISGLEDTESNSNITDMFDTKLFGYVMSEDTVVPPWEVTHFRINAEGSEMYPYGRTDLIDCLIPFKLAQSTQTLQALARTMSFPVQVFTVKTSQGMDEVSQFQAVEKVRQEYENVGVTPSAGQSEVYSVNTKMWIPEGLVDLEVRSAEVDIDFVGDLELYFDRVLMATGIPKGYIDQDWGWGNSAISLVEQYKPFGRKIYTLQSAFLEGLESIIRLHLAVTGEFDYKLPFTLSMRFPAEEASDEKNSSRTNSLDLAGSIIDAVKLALGTGEEEELPPAVVKDILGKYTFLSPEDVAKWTNDSNIYWTSAAGKTAAGGADAGGDMGGGAAGDMGGGADIGDVEAPADDGAEGAAAPDAEDDFDFGEASKRDLQLRQLREIQIKRLNELKKRYSETKNQIYINSLVENNINEFIRYKKHVKLMNYVETPASHYLEQLSKNKPTPGKKLKEKSSDSTLRDHLNKAKEEFSNDKEDLMSSMMSRERSN